MKKTILALLLAIAILTIPLTASASFSDVSSSHINATAIGYVQSEGIVNGYSDGTFRPDDTINRAELSKIIIEANFTETEIENCISDNTEDSWSYVFFPDVGESEWYAPYICLAKIETIVSGYDDGTFQPANPVNFAEAAKIISGAFGFSTNSDKVWYKPFVEQLASRNAIPTTITSFAKNITRGEMAEMIWRLKTDNQDEESLSYEEMEGDTLTLNYEDSPFGFIQGEVVYGQRPKATFLVDLGVHWNKVAAKNGIKFPSKDINDIDFNTEVDFTELDKYVKEIFVDNGINMPLPLMTFVEINNEEIQLTHEQYRELNTVLIERYNGDGVNDMEGSPKIKYWFVGASEMNTGIGKGLDIETRKWKLSEADTAEYVKIGYDLIKSFDSEFKVLLGGSAGFCTWVEGYCVDEDKPTTAEDHFYYNLISEMTGDLFCPDIIFDYHAGSNPTQFKAQIEAMNIVKETLTEFGYANNDIWTTDVGGSWDGLDGFTEIEQAGDVVRRYAYTIANGQEKLFWTRIEEYNWQGDTNPFDFYGLVNNPANADGKDWKKLSYYTYKLMVEKLEGSDWDNIQTIQESDNVYIYKFMKNNEPVWVAWWDYYDDTGTSKTISLDVGNINSVKITEAVPDTEDGSKIDENDYPDFFKTETKTASGGEIEIILGESPVFVEGK